MIFIIIIGKNTKKFRLKHDSKVSFCCIAIFIALATRHEIEYQRHSTRHQYAQNNNEQKKCQLGESAIRGQTESYFFFFVRCLLENIASSKYEKHQFRRLEHVRMSKMRTHRLSRICPSCLSQSPLVIHIYNFLRVQHTQKIVL